MTWLVYIFCIALICGMFGIIILIDSDFYERWTMKYDDFFKQKKNKPDYYFLYTRKLKKLAKNKTTFEVKNDISKATTFQDAFIKTYLSKRKNELKELGNVELFNQNYDHLYEKEMYEDVVKSRLDCLSFDMICDLIRNDDCGYYKDLVLDEYRAWFRDNMSNESVEKLVYMFDNYEDEFLGSDEVKKIICEKLEEKLYRLSKYERLYFKENAPRYIIDRLDVLWI